jgi:hypothetical protein
LDGGSARLKAAHYLDTGEHKHENKRTQTSMPQVGFEPTAAVFERAKTVHALDRAATFFLICIVGGGVQTGSTRHVGHSLAYCTCPDATLSTTNPTGPDPGLNPGSRGGKPATNRFSYGATARPL